MNYCDDLTVFNVRFSTMYGSSRVQNIHTMCHYLGVMQGTVCYRDTIETRPFVYFTPRDIVTANGWVSPPGCWRENSYIECAGERVDRLFVAFDAIKTPRIYMVDDAAAYVAILREMSRLQSYGTLQSQVRQVVCLEEFAALLQIQLHNQRNITVSRYGMEQVIRQINSEPGKNYCWRDEAAAAGITLRHWNRLFTDFAGLPPGEYLAKCRLKLARQLLNNGEMPIKEVAMYCGFVRAADFIRFFKKHTRVTPGDFRRRRLL